MFNIILPMTGFEPRTSGNGSDCSTNWATPLPKVLFNLKSQLTVIVSFEIKVFRIEPVTVGFVFAFPSVVREGIGHAGLLIKDDTLTRKPLRGNNSIQLRSCLSCCFAYVELASALLVWSNPNQSNSRSVTQWYFYLW